VRADLSLLFLELSGYCVNTVHLHINAADVLVRRGIGSTASDITACTFRGSDGPDGCRVDIG
jgi:hypothetical protein